MGCMEQLDNYILIDICKEPRKYELDVCYGVFEQFMNEGILNRKYDASESFCQIRDIFVLEFSMPFWQSFCLWCESFFYLKESMGVSLEVFYDAISRIPFKRILHLFDFASKESVRILLGDNKCINLFHCSRMKEKDYKFMLFCYQHPEFVTLPTVYKIGINWVVTDTKGMEM